MNFNGERTMEKYKVFPYIAWMLVFGFAFFVYNITLELREVSNDLKTSTHNLQYVSSQYGSNATKSDTVTQ